MMKQEDKRAIAFFELSLVLVAVFSFAYVLREDSQNWSLNEKDSEGIFLKYFGKVLEKLKEPILPLVSAQESGCCALTNSNEPCKSGVNRQDCSSDLFAEGAICTSVSFCQTGCCYDENQGIFDKNVLQSHCSLNWDGDNKECNFPSARRGCCFYGDRVVYENEGQCNQRFGDGDDVDWREMSELECMSMGAVQKEGACMVGENSCQRVSKTDCDNLGGIFSDNLLCTSSQLNSSCSPTEQKTCVEGKDGVYFLDSCGNIGNIYDSSKISDVDYWEEIFLPENSCNSDKGNAGSDSCGNCNRFLGGICGTENGEYVCKKTSCTLERKEYKNGESWCVYDGKIGDGDDVVGSRHWKYVCNQGEIQIEPCADYRNEICVQSNTLDFEEGKVNFRNAACRANNARSCLSLNRAEGGIEKCRKELDCEISSVRIGGSFDFDICTPKYPGGFSLMESSEQSVAEKICDIASRTCIVSFEEKDFGGCECVENCGCLEAGFSEQMNDVCRALGDCGLEANVEGKYTSNYGVTEAPRLGTEYINRIVRLANPNNYKGQYAEVGDVKKYLEAAGILNSNGNSPEENEGTDYTNYGLGIGLGVAGVAYAGYAAGIGIFTTTTAATGLYAVFPTMATAMEGLSGLSMGTPAAATMSAFTGAAIGAGVGMAVGALYAKVTGAPPGWSMVAMVSGAIAGSLAGYWIVTQNACLGGAAACGIAIGVAVVIMLISGLFGGDDCDPVTVEFKCNAWQPPSGASDCNKCNNDPLKPCSEYRCNSLGAGCEFINKGTEQEMCSSARDDGGFPQLNPQLGIISSNEKYTNFDERGFSITSLNDGCLDAYSNIVFGIKTDEPSQCKFDLEQKEFDEMSQNFGINSYTHNHTVSFQVPDPSEGESQGLDIQGDLTLYVKCRDRFGHETPSFYEVDMCINEGPDNRAPEVINSEPQNGALIPSNANSKESIFYINERSAQCKWDIEDKDYFLMTNSFVCEENRIYGSRTKCSGTLPTSSQTNTFFIRCIDQPWLEGIDDSSRNVNIQSYVYVLEKPENPITIDRIEPSGEMESSTYKTSFVLKIQTSGGGLSHSCSYSLSGYENLQRMFDTTIDKNHEQPLELSPGRKTFYIECEDETGETVRKEESLRIIHDTSTPAIARIWQNGRNLNFITSEDAECRYSTKKCSFLWDEGEDAGDGIEHTIRSIKGNNYYIKCRDDYGNSPSGCSIVARVL